MNFEEKIIFLNNLVDKTLTLTHYVEWELASYGSDSMFRQRGSIGYVHAKTISECVNKAFELVRKEIVNV